MSDAMGTIVQVFMFQIEIYQKYTRKCFIIEILFNIFTVNVTIYLKLQVISFIVLEKNKEIFDCLSTILLFHDCRLMC